MFKNLMVMMMRVKAPQLPPLGPKLSSSSIKIDNNIKRDNYGTCFTNFALLCCSVSFGVAVVSEQFHEASFILCLAVSGLCATLSGLCTAEFLANHAQNGYSVYGSTYHGVCEFLAYVIGWTWILSVGSCLASICIVLSCHVDDLTGGQLSEFFRSNLSSLGYINLLPTMFVFSVLVISVSGISHKNLWLLVSMPLAFACCAGAYALNYVDVFNGSWRIETPNSFDREKVMLGTALCSSAFIGCQSALRLPRFKFSRKLRILLGPLNIVNVFLVASFCLSFFIVFQNPKQLGSAKFVDGNAYFRVVQISLKIATLVFLALEYYHSLLMIIQDISTDGLLFRCLSKQWKPLFHRVLAFRTGVLVSSLVALLTMFFPVLQVLSIASAGILFINLIVSVAVLMQRYNFRDSWRYEPMLPNGSTSRHPSRTTGTEFTPTANSDSNGSRNSDSEEGDDTNSESETDIDAVVQEYKDKMRLKEVPDLLNSSPTTRCSTTFQQEPTSSTSFKSKVYASCYLVNCLLVGITLTVAIRTRISFDVIFVSAIGFTLILSLLLLCMLYRLPENNNSTVSKKHVLQAPMMPWTGGFAILLNSVLLVHVVVETWRILLSWTSVGLVIYLLYGIHNSTAASPFHSLPMPAQVSIQPFPKEKTSCRLIYPQKKPKNKIPLTL